MSETSVIVEHRACLIYDPYADNSPTRIGSWHDRLDEPHLGDKSYLIVRALEGFGLRPLDLPLIEYLLKCLRSEAKWKEGPHSVCVGCRAELHHAPTCTAEGVMTDRQWHEHYEQQRRERDKAEELARAEKLIAALHEAT